MNTALSWIKAYVPELSCTDQEYTDGDVSVTIPRIINNNIVFVCVFFSILQIISVSVNEIKVGW